MTAEPLLEHLDRYRGLLAPGAPSITRFTGTVTYMIPNK